MKEQILAKIANNLRKNGLDKKYTSEQAFNEIVCATGSNFSDLMEIYDFTQEERDYLFWTVF